MVMLLSKYITRAFYRMLSNTTSYCIVSRHCVECRIRQFIKYHFRPFIEYRIRQFIECLCIVWNIIYQEIYRIQRNCIECPIIYFVSNSKTLTSDCIFFLKNFTDYAYRLFETDLSFLIQRACIFTYAP